MKKIEEDKGYKDLGKMGYLVFYGALEEAPSRIDAFLVTVAYFRGMFGSAHDQPKEDET